MRAVLVLGLVAVMLCATAATAGADVHVRGYYRSNGTYVRPHWRSDPDSSFDNNWSTYPNVNPYTGKIGTRRTPSYGTPAYRLPNLEIPRAPIVSPPSYDWDW